MGVVGGLGEGWAMGVVVSGGVGWDVVVVVAGSRKEKEWRGRVRENSISHARMHNTLFGV